MNSDLGYVCRDGHVRKEGARTSRLVTEVDKALYQTLEAQRNMYRGEEKHEDGRGKDRFELRTSALVSRNEQIRAEQQQIDSCEFKRTEFNAFRAAENFLTYHRTESLARWR